MLHEVDRKTGQGNPDGKASSHPNADQIAAYRQRLEEMARIAPERDRYNRFAMLAYCDAVIAATHSILQTPGMPKGSRPLREVLTELRRKGSFQEDIDLVANGCRLTVQSYLQERPMSPQALLVAFNDYLDARVVFHTGFLGEMAKPARRQRHFPSASR